MKEMPKPKPVAKETKKKKPKRKSPKETFPHSDSGRSFDEMQLDPRPVRPDKKKWRCDKCKGKMRGGVQTVRRSSGSVRHVCLTCEV